MWSNVPGENKEHSIGKICYSMGAKYIRTIRSWQHNSKIPCMCSKQRCLIFFWPVTYQSKIKIDPVKKIQKSEKLLKKFIYFQLPAVLLHSLCKVLSHFILFQVRRRWIDLCIRCGSTPAPCSISLLVV